MTWRCCYNSNNISQQEKQHITSRATTYHNKRNNLSHQEKQHITTRAITYHNKSNNISQQEQQHTTFTHYVTRSSDPIRSYHQLPLITSHCLFATTLVPVTTSAPPLVSPLDAVRDRERKEEGRGRRKGEEGEVPGVRGCIAAAQSSWQYCEPSSPGCLQKHESASPSILFTRLFPLLPLPLRSSLPCPSSLSHLVSSSALPTP